MTFYSEEDLLSSLKRISCAAFQFKYYQCKLLILSTSFMFLNNIYWMYETWCDSTILNLYVLFSCSWILSIENGI